MIAGSANRAGLDLKSEKKEKTAKKVLDHGADLAFEAESESGDFDANELLNFSDYKNKR